MAEPGAAQSADASMPVRRRGRGLAVVVLAGVIGAALVAIAAGLTWWSADYTDPLTGPLTVTLSGGSCVPELIPLALVGLAGLGAALATGGLPRRLVGLVVLACGVAVAVRSALSFGAAPAALAGSLTRPADPAGAAQLHPAGPALAVLGGLLLSAAGVLVVLGVGARRLSARYERTRYGPASGGRTASGAGTAGRPQQGEVQPGAMEQGELEQGDWWKALDAGADPTANAAVPALPTPGATTDATTGRNDNLSASGASGTGDGAGTDVEPPHPAGSVTGSGTDPTRPGTTSGSPEGTLSEQASGDGYDDPQALRPT